MQFEGDKIWFDPRQDVGAEERRVAEYDPEHPEPVEAYEVFLRYWRRNQDLLMERQDSQTMHRPGHTHDYGIVRAVLDDFQKYHPDYFL